MKLIHEKVELKKNQGIDSFLAVVKTILQKSKVQTISIDKNTISFSRYVPDDAQPDVLDLTLATVSAWGVIRNLPDIQELRVDHTDSPLVMVHKVFSMSHVDRLVLTHIVMSSRSYFLRWVRQYVSITGDVLFNLPIVFEDDMPVETVVFLAGYEHSKSMLDAVKGYKGNAPVFDLPVNPLLQSEEPAGFLVPEVDI